MFAAERSVCLRPPEALPASTPNVKVRLLCPDRIACWKEAVSSERESSPDRNRPRPAGHVQFSYSPVSPMQYSLVPLGVDVLVYPRVELALEALSYWVEKIWAKRASSGRSAAPPFPIFFRGQSDIGARLLPTLLRGQGPAPPQPERPRYATVDPAAPDADKIYEQYGEWFETEQVHSADELMVRITAQWLFDCGRREQAALTRAVQFPEVAALDPFQQRATVRHYAEIPSLILDVTKDPKVAALFATGGWAPPDRTIPVGLLGMIWGIDLNPLSDLFHTRIEDGPTGKRFILEKPKDWGINKEMFADQQIPTAQLVFSDIELPFARPKAQKGMFLTIADIQGRPLPIIAELHWWSMIERWAYPTGFIHDGRVYEDPEGGVTRRSIDPPDDPLRVLSGVA